MADLNEDRSFDFELQLEEAQACEDRLRKILAGGKFELKTERKMWHETGNIVIEYESHGKPSGIAATNADYWAHELCMEDGTTLAYVVFPTPILRSVCNTLMEEGHWRRGGEGGNMEMLLLSLEKMFEYLKGCAGKGCDKFLPYEKK